MNNSISENIFIEELVEKYPLSVSFLREKGLVCILCGEPVWGTLSELAKSKGFTDIQIQEIVQELNQKF